MEDGPAEYEECEKLTSFDLARDAILFGLRMNQGISPSGIARSFGLEKQEVEPVLVFLERLAMEGMGTWRKDWFSLTSKGRILADAIALEMPELAFSVGGYSFGKQSEAFGQPSRAGSLEPIRFETLD